MLDLVIGFAVGVIATSIVFAFRLKDAEDERAYFEAKYKSLRGFFDARVAEVKAKADETKAAKKA